MERGFSQVPGDGDGDEKSWASAVLIVEPDPERQSRLARMFTNQGLRVIGTASADGALALLGSFPVDLLLVAEECSTADVIAIAQAALARHRGTRVLMIGEQPVSSARHAHRSVPQIEYVERPARMEQVATLVA